MSDLPPGIEQWAVDKASDGHRFTDDEGKEWVVLVSERNGTRELVRDDVVEYGRFDHPVVGGAAGLVGLLASLLLPLYPAYVLSQSYSPSIGVGIVFGGVVGAYLLAQFMLFYTPIGAQLFRFLEWREHQYLVMSKRGEA